MYVCRRNCIIITIIIIIIIIVIIIIIIFIIIITIFLNIWRDVVYFVYYYNCVRCCCGDVSKSPGDCNFFGLLLVHWGLPAKSQLLEFLQHLKEDGCGMRWRVIAISLLKMYVRGWHVKLGEVLMLMLMKAGIFLNEIHILCVISTIIIRC